MSAQSPTIIYTLTDEAPLLATNAFLPIIRTFAAPAGIHVDTRDISVAARVLAAFPECLSEEQRVSDDLGELVPRGWDELTTMIRRFVDVGFSKFVVLPLVEPATSEAWVTHLEEAAPVLLPLQT